jgi:hypothetical protein
MRQAKKAGQIYPGGHVNSPDSMPDLNFKEMTKVYVLQGWNADESSILGVFSSAKIAEEAKKLFNCDFFHVYTFEIDVI